MASRRASLNVKFIGRYFPELGEISFVYGGSVLSGSGHSARILCKGDIPSFGQCKATAPGITDALFSAIKGTSFNKHFNVDGGAETVTDVGRVALMYAWR